MSCATREIEDARPPPTNKKSHILRSRRSHSKIHKRHRRFTMMKRSTTLRVHRFTSKWKKLGGEKLHRDDKEMRVKNFKLYMENKTILENNKQLRMKLLLLRQENLALFSQFHHRFSTQQQNLPVSHLM